MEIVRYFTSDEEGAFWRDCVTEMLTSNARPAVTEIADSADLAVQRLRERALPDRERQAWKSFVIAMCRANAAADVSIIVSAADSALKQFTGRSKPLKIESVPTGSYKP